MLDFKDSPYYAYTDTEKQYYQLLALPGRVAQAREITELQTILRNIVKSVGDSILRNGDIIEGCQVLVQGNSVTVTSGKVYMEGIVMPLQESIVSIRGTGTETIGIKLLESIIDENTDPTLRDPAQGFDNYNQPGCHRLKRYLQVVANDMEAATIATLVDGAIMVETYAPEYDTLTQTLARRTYDESGSYIVEGLNSRVERLDEFQYNLVVESGKAYVLGYELKIPTARRIKVNRSTTYEEITIPTNQYKSGISNYLLDSDPHVRSLIQVQGIVSKEVNQTINNNLAAVTLPDSPVYSITSVVQGSKTFKVGSTPNDGDCYLYNDGTTYILKWNGTDNYPSLGVTYTVTYQYQKTFVEGVDYQLSLIDNSHYLTWLPGGSTPLDSTLFSVVYEQYLARKDLVYLDKYGFIDVIEGVPAPYGSEVLPEAPLNTLTIAYINNPPNSTVGASTENSLITVENVGLKRFTMNDIQNLLNRIQTIEYDQAVISLNDDARQVDTASDKKGIFTDPLIDLSRIDFYYNLDSSGAIKDSSLPVYDMALDLACNICYLPVVSNTNYLEYDTDISTVHRYDRLVSLAVTGENVVLSQPHATKSFLINPYSMFPQMPEVSIDPAVDSWIEDTIIEVPVSLTDSAIVSMSTRTLDNTTAAKNSNSNWAKRTSTSTTDTAIGTRTEAYTSDSVISESSITYIRQRVITVEGNNFPSNLKNIVCYFDGVVVPLTPVGGTEAGSVSGSVNANSDGYLKATFQIPQGIMTGTREVLLKSATPIDGLITEGFALYIAAGTARRIERTVTTVTTVLLERVTTTTLTNVYVDPVGQTFILDKMTLLKGIDLYFESKPTVNTPVVCEIRGVSNGTINSTVYARKSLFPQEVNTSTDASLATRFNFTDPMLVEENKEYAFVVRSTSDAYRIWVSELGGVDVNTKDIILKNPYMTGVMMSSSNNSTWTSHQTTDIKFRLLEDTYTNTSNIIFKEVSTVDAARLYLSADSATPQGTSVDWSYSLDGTTYQSITPYNIKLLNGTYKSVYMRATLSKIGNTNLSPLLALDTISLVDSHYDLSGHYISRNVTGLDPYTNVRILLDTYELAGTSITVRVSKDNGVTWVTATKGNAEPLNYGWQEVTYNASVSNATQLRIDISAESTMKYRTPAFRRLRCIMF